MFEIFGAGIGMPGFNQPAGFPLQTELAGTSVRVTIGGQIPGRIDIRQLPVAYEAVDRDGSSPRYLARFPNYDVLLDSRAIAVRLSAPTTRVPRALNGATPSNTATLQLSFQGKNKASVPVGTDKLRGKANYFIGNDPKKWMRGIPLYGSVLYPEVYSGVDFIFQNNKGRLGYRIELDHGEAAHQIALQFSGHDGIRLNAQGEIEVSTAAGRATWTAPKAFWETSQGLIRAEATYAIHDDGSIGFEIEGPIRPDPLIIDPDLVFSTFIGGSLGDFINGLALAENGNIVVTGATNSLDFPRSANAAQSNNAGFLDTVVTMLRPDASEIVFSTYLGGLSLDAPNGIAIMADGSISICGFTGSTNFPTSLNAIQANNNALPDAFVSQLSESGDTLLFSSYFGGSSDDNCTSMAAGPQDRLLITGYTSSTDFPITPGAMSTQHQGGRSAITPLEYDGFFSVLRLDQPGIEYSTFLGGSGSELQVVQFVGPDVEGLAFEMGPWLTIDDEGGVYLAGATASADFLTTPGSFMQSLRGSTSAFIIKLAADDYSLAASTLLGGDAVDGALSIAISRDGKVVVGGITSSSDFPVSSSAFQPGFGGGPSDGFLVVLDNDLQALEYGTHIGGRGFDAFFANVAAENRIHIGGVTSSSDLPSSPDALQPGFAGVTDTYFLTFHLSTNTVEFSTYIGGSGQEVLSRPMTASDGGVLLFGGSSSPGFMTTSGVIGETYGGGESDGAIVKFAGAMAPAVLLHGGSFLPRFAPNTWVSVFLTDPVDAATRIWGGPDFADNRLPEALDGFSVSFNGRPGYVSFISPTQFNVLSPVMGVAGPVEVRVATPGGPIDTFTVTADEFAPGLFMFNPQGRKYVAAVHLDGFFVGPGDLFGGAVPARPAAPGDTIQVFATGFGQTAGGISEGEILVFDLQRDRLANEVVFQIDDTPVIPSFAGLVGAGLYQFNVLIPSLAAGDHSISASVGGFSTQPGAFLALADAQ